MAASRQRRGEGWRLAAEADSPVPFSGTPVPLLVAFHAHLLNLDRLGLPALDVQLVITDAQRQYALVDAQLRRVEDEVLPDGNMWANDGKRPNRQMRREEGAQVSRCGAALL